MKTKTHLVIPRVILEQVDQIAGKRKRSLFISQATEEKIKKERFLKALEETHGSWSDQNHPDLKTDRDVDKYIREKRALYRRRLRRTDLE